MAIEKGDHHRAPIAAGVAGGKDWSKCRRSARLAVELSSNGLQNQQHFPIAACERRVFEVLLVRVFRRDRPTI
ncbi:hypothetical protein [Bradyrhizobium sp.]|uniref:hypothetical protein n=1 Tax=Bradyrhizobium sp. TaxID=376 RepID=UPI003C38F67C